MLEKLCAPAILYIAFSLTQIIIDIFKEMYNTAFFQVYRNDDFFYYVEHIV